MKYALCATKLGWVGIGIEDGKIRAATLPASREETLERLVRAGATEPADESEAAPLLELARRAAEGEEVDARSVVSLPEGTAFQRAVWEAMLSIPRGETLSYGDIARMVGKPGAARAVGQVVGHNPIPLFVPCHRVVASNGGLGGFGGGLPMKQALLRAEGASL